MIGIILAGIVGLVVLVAVVCAFAWYRIVDPSEAHLVSTPSGKFVVSADENVGDRRTYFAIPSWVPFFGRAIRVMDVTIQSIDLDQETIEKNQARYSVKSSTKYRIKDVKTAADTYINDKELKSMLEEIVKSGVRTVTVKYDLTEARSNKQTVEKAIRIEIADDLAAWGLELKNFQLVDFLDTADSEIVSNISKRSEVEIEARTREQNAEKLKQAKIKETEAEEKTGQRNLEKERVLGEQGHKKDQMVSIAEKLAEEKKYEVVKVRIIKQAEIDKEKAEVEANQAKQVAIIKANEDKEAEAIRKEQKKLSGEGDRLKAEQIAKGEAAPIREKGNANAEIIKAKGNAEAEIIKAKGFAEAEAKDKLQKALNLFKDNAIRALVAEKIVTKDQAVGMATAAALEKSDLKVFAGGGASGAEGFDLGKLISATSVANADASLSLTNRLARPNDIGFKVLGLNAVSEDVNMTKSNEKKTNKKA